MTLDAQRKAYGHAVRLASEGVSAETIAERVNRLDPLLALTPDDVPKFLREAEMQLGDVVVSRMRRSAGNGATVASEAPAGGGLTVKQTERFAAASGSMEDAVDASGTGTPPEPPDDPYPRMHGAGPPRLARGLERQSAWWERHLDEIHAIGVPAFAKKYGLTPTFVYQKRRAFEARSQPPRFPMRTVEELAEEQGVKPIKDASELSGDRPEGESDRRGVLITLEEIAEVESWFARLRTEIDEAEARIADLERRAGKLQPDALAAVAKMAERFLSCWIATSGYKGTDEYAAIITSLTKALREVGV